MSVCLVGVDGGGECVCSILLFLQSEEVFIHLLDFSLRACSRFLDFQLIC